MTTIYQLLLWTPLSRLNQLLLSCAATLSIMLGVYSQYTPFWMTNDDIILSMIAHGYGVADVGTSQLVFTINAIWGAFVRMLPTIWNTPGYSIASLLVLFVVGTVLIYGLMQLRTGFVPSLVCLLLTLTLPLLVPQFTINSGLLVIAGIVCWQVYDKQKQFVLLCIGCLLFWGSFLIRWEICILMTAASFFFIPWRTFIKNRRVIIVLLLLAIAIGTSWLYDRSLYKNETWAPSFKAHYGMYPVMRYNQGANLLARPDLLAKHGYTANDIMLLANFFFEDKYVADADRLKALMRDLGNVFKHSDSFTSGWEGVKTFCDPLLLPLVIAALLLAIFRHNWKVLATWGLCVSAIFSVSFLGRPSQLRVYVPVVSLLLIVPFFTPEPKRWIQHCSIFFILMFACYFNFGVGRHCENRKIESDKVIEDLKNFPTETVFLWGENFPYEWAYPVFNLSPQAMKLRIYGFICFPYAPPLVQTTEMQKRCSMIERLLSTEGILLMADENRLRMLDIYCQEHLNGQLFLLDRHQYGYLWLYDLRCIR